MTSSPPQYGAAGRSRVVIAGGGIAGLAIAHALRREAPGSEILVLEARDEVGGNIRSERINGYLCEWGPDGVLDNAPGTLALIDEVGLSSKMLPSRESARRRYVYHSGRLHEVPVSVGAFVTSGLLSVRGKLGVALEPFTRRAPLGDETIHDFAERHIGREAADVLVGAMVSGIFAGDAAALSLQACFPKMWEMEHEHGTLVRALIARRKERRAGPGLGSPSGRLVSFTGGMADLVRGVAAALGPAVHTGCGVIAVREWRAEGGPHPLGARQFTVRAGGRSIEADALVLAGPSPVSADLLRSVDAPLAEQLDRVDAAPLAVVCLGYDEAALAADRGPLDGFGFLVPRDEGTRILGALWESTIYAGRAPAGKALVRVMIGGATDPAAVRLDDAELVQSVRTDLERTMGLRIAPEFVRVVRHRRGIPQYTVGHVARLTRIDRLLDRHPGLFLAGNSYRGVSINACIADASGIAARVADHVRMPQRPSPRAAAAR